jgi:C-terminal processing protease CtpA/Prc
MGRPAAVTLLFAVLSGAAAPSFSDPVPTLPDGAFVSTSAGSEPASKAVSSWAGFGGVTINEMLADRLELPSAGGVIVTFVHPAGPAAKAGLAARDMILTADGEIIPDGEKWSKLLADLAPGTKIELGVRREGEELSLDLTLEELPPDVEVEPSPRS